MKLLGKTPWERNPSLCRDCFNKLSKIGVGGAELEVGLVFADIRGSTTLAEHMSPREYGELINLFFRTATDVIIRHDGIIDQLVGDEVVGVFLPGFTGPEYAKQAIETGRMLVEAMETQTVGGHSLPIGVGVHTGIAYVGTVGSADSFTDFTVLGDAVNTTARLASAAAAGEVLVSEAALARAGMKLEGAERRELSLKGKAEVMQVAVIRGEGVE
jgi:adenylate cyclase